MHIAHAECGIDFFACASTDPNTSLDQVAVISLADMVICSRGGAAAPSPSCQVVLTVVHARVAAVFECDVVHALAFGDSTSIREDLLGLLLGLLRRCGRSIHGGLESGVVYGQSQSLD